MIKTILRFAVAISCTFSVMAQSMPKSLLGFSEAQSRDQRSVEQKFDAILNPANLREWMKLLSARPHHLGSPYDKENAEFIASQFKSWGFDTKIEEFQVLFPTPKTRIVQMTTPERFTLTLNEPPIIGDETSDQQKEQLPTYNA